MATKLKTEDDSDNIYSAIGKIRKIPIEQNGSNPAFKKDGQPSKYSTIDDVLNVLKHCDRYGLEFCQTFDNYNLITKIIHLKTGEVLESVLPINNDKNTPQAFVSVVTYLRRVSLITMFGFSSEMDDDGNFASGVSNNVDNDAGQSAEIPPRRSPNIPKKQTLGEAHCD